MPSTSSSLPLASAAVVGVVDAVGDDDDGAVDAVVPALQRWLAAAVVVAVASLGLVHAGDVAATGVAVTGAIHMMHTATLSASVVAVADGVVAVGVVSTPIPASSDYLGASFHQLSLACDTLPFPICPICTVDTDLTSYVALDGPAWPGMAQVV